MQGPKIDPEVFGSCPHCRKNDGVLRAGKTHVSYCREHKIMWSRGNIFSWPDPEELERQRAEWDRLGLEEFEMGPGMARP